MVVVAWDASRAAWTHDDKGFFYSRYPKPKSHEEGAVVDKGTETDALSFHKVRAVA